jgi:hypothetical protein
MTIADANRRRGIGAADENQVVGSFQQKCFAI